MSEKTDEKIGQLQLIEQNIQQLLMQRQQFQMQMNEVESALGELKSTKDSYKIIGSIMIKKSKEELEKELNEKKEMLSLRIKAIEKQEKAMKEKAKGIQKEVVEEMKNEQGNA